MVSRFAIPGAGFRIAVAAFAGTYSIASAPQALTIAAPVYAAGDTWTFRVTTSTGKTRTEERSILSVEDPTRMLVRIKHDGAAEYFDSAMNVVPDGNPELTQVYVRYPMHVGDTWSFTRRYDDPNSSLMGSSEAVSEEEITVPAGTFRCLKVKANWTYTWKVWEKVYRQFVRWYCPEVKWFAKMQADNRTEILYNPGGNAHVEAVWELVSFVPGQKP